MSIASGPNVVHNGLVFSFDMNNTEKSWKGKPTTNLAYEHNARPSSTYELYSATSSGTWNAKHPDAIRVYNDNGTEITGYVNTGVTDWTNTYHAIWTYDDILKKPVVTMRDYDGQWKAKSFGLSGNFSTWGLSNGSQYTISWLSWTTDITKCANAGIYRYSTSNGYWNFWDGLSNSYSTAFNTLPNTWQRVYATFTVQSSADLTSGISCYMYGYFGNRGIVKIADVQIETGTVSGFSKTLTRSSTESIIDNTNNNVVTMTSASYANDGSLSFNGSNNYLTISSFASKPTTAITCEAWIKPTKPTVGTGTIRGGAISCTNSTYLGIIDSTDGGNTFSMHWASQTSASRLYNWNGSIPNNQWSYLVGTYDGTTSRAYLNGVEIWSTAQSGTIPDGTYVIGTYGQILQDGVHNFQGVIPYARIYNRALSSLEVQQNFNALRGRYGI